MTNNRFERARLAHLFEQWGSGFCMLFWRCDHRAWTCVASSFSSARPDLAIMLGQTLEAVAVGLVRHPCGYLSAIRSRPEIDRSYRKSSTLIGVLRCQDRNDEL